MMNAGDIESMPFIEALGQFSYRVGKTTVFLTLFFFLNKFCPQASTLLHSSINPFSSL